MVILLSGKQGSGKSTLARELQDQLALSSKLATKIRFAGPLYEMHDAVLAICDKYRIQPTQRPEKKLLQLLGTEWGRNMLGEDVWVNAARTAIQEALVWADAVIVEDCRFPNELKVVPGAIKVRLECNRDDRKLRTESWRDSENHPSETSLDGYEDEFNFILNTGIYSPKACAEIILGGLGLFEVKRAAY